MMDTDIFGYPSKETSQTAALSASAGSETGSHSWAQTELSTSPCLGQRLRWRGRSALKSGGGSLSLMVSFCSFRSVDNDPWKVDRKSGSIISSSYNNVVCYF